MKDSVIIGIYSAVDILIEGPFISRFLFPDSTFFAGCGFVCENLSDVVRRHKILICTLNSTKNKF